MYTGLEYFRGPIAEHIGVTEVQAGWDTGSPRCLSKPSQDKYNITEDCSVLESIFFIGYYVR